MECTLVRDNKTGKYYYDWLLHFPTTTRGLNSVSEILVFQAYGGENKIDIEYIPEVKLYML